MSNITRFSPLPTVKELLKLYRINALKKLSQNFLLEKRLTDKIVNTAGNITNGEVCEIGPGPGSITRSILMKEPKRVIAVEKDCRFQPMLEALENSTRGKLTTVYSDIRGFDFRDTFDASLAKSWEDEPPNIHIIGNLPFSVSNVLIFQFLEDISLRRNAWSFGRVCMTLTFQDEVAKRMIADVLMKARGRISVMCQNWCKVSYKFSIPGKAFLPKPEVTVGVLHFEPLVRPIIDLDYRLVEKVLRTIFNCRQKYIIHPAKNLFPKELRATLVEEMFDIAEIHPRLRSFQLSNEDWKSLCFAYKQICDRDPRLYSYNFRGCKATREDDWRKAEVDERQTMVC